MACHLVSLGGQAPRAQVSEHPAEQGCPLAQRIFPFHDADARPPDGVLQGQAEQGTGWPGGSRAALLLRFPVLLPLPLCGADRGDGRIASAAHELGLTGGIDGGLPG